MRMQTLEDLYLDQIRELFSANEQVLVALKDLSIAANDSALSEALTATTDCFLLGNATLSAIAERHDENVEGGQCVQMEGLISAARTAMLDEPQGERATQDVRIVVHMRRISHFVVASCETLASLALRLDLIDDVPMLRRCGDETSAADKRVIDYAAQVSLE